MLRKMRADVLLAIGGILLIALFAVLRAQMEQQNRSEPSTYDYGANGLAALYELLAREKVDVSRFETPMGELRKRKGAFVIAGGTALFALAIDRAQQKTLETWTQRGGVLVLMGERPPIDMFDLSKKRSAQSADLRNVCALARKHVNLSCNDAHAVIYRRGRGWIVYVSAPLDNAHIANGDNANFAYALFSAIAPVAFDERVYGYTTDRSMWQVLPASVHYAIGVALLALLLGLIGANVRFAPAVDLSERHIRDSSEYLQSLAALLRRGRAQVDVVRRFARAMERMVAGRHGDARAAAILEQARSLSLRVDADDRDVVAAAQLYTRLRKDMT